MSVAGGVLAFVCDFAVDFFAAGFFLAGAFFGSGVCSPPHWRTLLAFVPAAPIVKGEGGPPNTVWIPEKTPSPFGPLTDWFGFPIARSRSFSAVSNHFVESRLFAIILASIGFSFAVTSSLSSSSERWIIERYIPSISDFVAGVYHFWASS